MAEQLELALARVQEAMGGVIVAWEAEQPDPPVQRAQEPNWPVWRPDPTQAPVTTRQWAEVMRLRASALRQEGRQLRAEAAQTRQATRTERAFRRRLAEGQLPGYFIRVSPAILIPPTRRPC